MTEPPVVDIDSEPIVILKSLKGLTNEVDDHSYDKTFDSLQLSILNKSYKVAAREVLVLYKGGMGSFNDFVLHHKGKVEMDLMRCFDKLRKELFNWAVANL